MTYAALGKNFSVTISTPVGDQRVGVDVPVEQWMHDAVTMASNEAAAQLPKLVQNQLMPILQKQVLPPLMKQVEGEIQRNVLPMVRKEIDRTISSVSWRALGLGVLLCGTIVGAAYWQRKGTPEWLSKRMSKKVDS